MEHLDHPSPHFNDAKMACFLFLRAFIIALAGGGGGGWGIIDPFYNVQDCSLTTSGTVTHPREDMLSALK